MPTAKPTPGTLGPGAVLDLGELFGSDLEGFRLSRAGLQIPGWRGPIPIPELRSMFWQCQHVRILARDLDRSRSELAAALAELDTAQARARWYRSQLRLEARAGLMLSALQA